MVTRRLLQLCSAILYNCNLISDIPAKYINSEFCVPGLNCRGGLPAEFHAEAVCGRSCPSAPADFMLAAVAGIGLRPVHLRLALSLRVGAGSAGQNSGAKNQKE